VRPNGRRLRRGAAVALAAVALAVAAATASGAQERPAPRYRETVAPLPAPAGPAPTGTRVLYLTDSARRDRRFPGGRPVTVQLWYPAASSRAPRAPYLFERGLGAALLRIDYYGIDSAALRKWATLKTDAGVNAPVQPGRYPLIAFSVGQGVIRANYTALAEEMSSHGYIVALVESPLQGLMLTRDGAIIADTSDALEQPAALRAAVAGWSADISFALDRLQSRMADAGAHAVAAAIDWSKVGAMGHSVGGLVAIATCEHDRRVRACINLDGGVASPEREPLADFVVKGITTPTLVLRSKPLYTDADFARRGLTRAQWEKRAEGGRIAFDSLVARSKGPLWVGFVAGTGHMSFTDAPFVMPTTITRFGGKVIEPKRGLFVIQATVRTFFDQTFGNWPDTMGRLAARVPEVEVTRAK